MTHGAGNSATTQVYWYSYDALGRRVTKTDTFGTTTFAWDGDQMVLEQRGAKETLRCMNQAASCRWSNSMTASCTPAPTTCRTARGH